MPGHIVVVGSINMDLVVRAPRHPLPGETILGSDFQTFPGGKGANQAVAAARAGGTVKMVGRVGIDPFGDVMLNNLKQDGVDTTYVLRTERSASGVALITVSDAGQNNIVVVPGSNWVLTPDDILAADRVFEGSDVVLLQLEIPLETAAEAVRMGKRHGAKIILNPAPARPLDHDLLNQIDYLVPNEHELYLLTGKQSLEPAVTSFQSISDACLIVTLGADGVLVQEGDQAARIEAHQVRVIDTTAAGDAFVGAFAVALTQGLSTVEAAGWGNAAGALAVTAAGAQPSLPKRAEIENFMKNNPERFLEE